jgi:hypothetical protein
MRTKHIFKDDEGSLISFSSEEVAKMNIDATALKVQIARLPADAMAAVDSAVKK